MVERSVSGLDMADTMAGIGGSRLWFVAYGVLSVVAGVAAVALPGVTVLTLAVLFAAQLFILGIFRIVAAFAVPDTSTGMRVLAIVVGVLSVIVGVLCLRSPLQTIVVLTLVLGAFWLFNGMMKIIAGIAGRGERSRVWSIVGGLIGHRGPVRTGHQRGDPRLAARHPARGARHRGDHHRLHPSYGEGIARGSCRSWYRRGGADQILHDAFRLRVDGLARVEPEPVTACRDHARLSSAAHEARRAVEVHAHGGASLRFEPYDGPGCGRPRALRLKGLG